jgi:hypothetical protein
LIPVYYHPLLWHISSFCILLSTVVAYFLIPVYYYPLLHLFSS